MDANQDRFANPFGMDEACTNCDVLCEARERIVHGYGDVGAEFLFVGEAPGPGAEAAGVPFVGDPGGERLWRIVADLGFVVADDGDAPAAIPALTAADDGPHVENCFLTYLSRCRHPERPPSDAEVRTCEPYLNAEVRMINPEIIVPVGQRVLAELALEYTTRQPDSFDVEAEHATTVRGRGFELVPMLEPERQTDADTRAFVEHVREDVLGRDYRQTKGRRGR